MAFPNCIRMSKIVYFILISSVAATGALCPHQDDGSADYLDTAPAEDTDATEKTESLLDDSDLEEQLNGVSDDGSMMAEYRDDDNEKTRRKKSMMGLFGLATKRPQFHKTQLEGHHFGPPKGNFLPVRGKKAPWQKLRTPFRSSYSSKYGRQASRSGWMRFFADCAK